MALINPSSAVIAKARSKYGKRLKDKDYAAMMKCDTVTEVVMYLKSYTYYQRFLNKVNTNDIHRGQVEHVLREALFEDFLSLCRYNRSDSPVTTYLLTQAEIDQIIRFVTLLSIGKPGDYLFSLPLYFLDHSSVDLEKMSRCRSYPEFLEVIEKTKYGKQMKDFSPSENGRLDIPAIEDALEIFALKELYDTIGKIRDKKDRAQLLELFDTLSDFRNFYRIVRLKKFYRMSGENIRAHLLPYGTLSGRKLDETLSKDSYDEMLECLFTTKPGKKVRNLNINVDRDIADFGSYHTCKNAIYFSTNPEIVFLAYFILSGTELNNVINVIEGVRYRLEPRRIAAILIRG